jgi:hypothetical protein
MMFGASVWRRGGDVWEAGDVRGLGSERRLSDLHRWRGQGVTLLMLIVFGKTRNEGGFAARPTLCLNNYGRKAGI